MSETKVVLKEELAFSIPHRPFRHLLWKCAANGLFSTESLCRKQPSMSARRRRRTLKGCANGPAGAACRPAFQASIGGRARNLLNQVGTSVGGPPIIDPCLQTASPTSHPSRRPQDRVGGPLGVPGLHGRHLPLPRPSERLQEASRAFLKGPAGSSLHLNPPEPGSYPPKG